MPREIITKLDAARLQLELAIRLYFDRGDVVSIHALAGAAREIYEVHCTEEGRFKMVQQLQLCNPTMTSKDIWDVLNRVRNFVKHAKKETLHDTIELGDEDNKLALFIAAHDCSSLMGKDTPRTFLLYSSWYVATMPAYRAHLPELDDKFPGLHEAPEEIQRLAGKALMQVWL